MSAPRSSFIVEFGFFVFVFVFFFATLGFLIFHTKLRIDLSMSVKNCLGILIEIALKR